jgi:hypothetical protein
MIFYYNTKIIKLPDSKFLLRFCSNPLRPFRIKISNPNNYLAIGAYFKEQDWNFPERTLDRNEETEIKSMQNWNMCLRNKSQISQLCHLTLFVCLFFFLDLIRL